MSERQYIEILKRLKGRAATILITALAFGIAVLYLGVVILIFKR